MEPILTNLSSNPNLIDKRHNLKRPANPSATCNKISPFMVQSRSPSPAESIMSASTITPKPNQVRASERKLLISPLKMKNHFGSSKQVGTVILYGIPIVSLYIESQERLCLAQISNTLLKQFSYNEIHNRRVALGITCVQCTPVQLEILRRANAMPVSSRRCGMITRREAERLCKSFLGDNSPPRLPDDFSFAAFHECAWGCRGSFLPSRYNSSRAKCIKCSFCGLFFSPNKFIFHSHRVSANDKYVQPDAANFNSWRRHLKLSGTPPDDVAHAWEDVKAMFNGGTRKRLMSTPMSSMRDSNPQNSSSAAKKAKESPVIPQNPPQTSQYPVRAVNHPYTVASNTSNSPSVNSIAPIVTSTPPTLRAPTSFPQELPFSLSRSFMIDYMWHHQQQQQTSTPINTPTVANKANHFQFPPYSALNWIKQPPPSFLFKPNGAANDEKPPAFNHFHSAFKPVINMRLNEDTNANNVSMVNINPNTQSPTSSTSSNYNHTTASSTNQSDDEQLTPVKKLSSRKRPSKNSKDFYVDVDETSNQGERKICVSGENGEGFDGNTKDQMTSDDENEMVDIETTEDDIQILNLQPFKVSHHIEVETEEEIEVTDEKFTQLENNNNLKSFEHDGSVKIVKRPKSPIKSLKEIVNRSDRDNEEYFVGKRNSRASPNYHEWTLNLKKEVRQTFISIYVVVSFIDQKKRKIENLK